MSPVAADSPCRSLLVDAIDYAGLFPPAALDMAAAVRAYREYLDGPDAWALGRFVVPAARLEDLMAARESLPPGTAPWLLAVTCGADPVGDAGLVARFARVAPREQLRADTVEFPAASPEALLDTLAALPDTLHRFAEIPLGEDPVPFVSTLKFRGAAAKFRTGGVTPEAFPDPDDLMRGLEAVVRAGVPLKCTAGLHHPVRGRYRLTYEPASPAATMYGYLNVFLCAAALAQGERPAVARAILLEEDPGAFAVRGGELAWRDRSFDRAMLRAVRRRVVRSFGSCSFREPLDELNLMVVP